MSAATALVTLDEHTEALRRWIDDNASSLDRFRGPVAEGVQESVDHCRELMALLCDAGWSRWGWPESIGGLGGGETHRAVLYDELGAAGIEIPEAFVVLETVAPVLQKFSPDIAALHLPKYLAGEELWGQGFSEPEAGSDLGSIRTTARADGGGFVLNGQKTWMTLGPSASYAVVLARTGSAASRHRALTMFWVDLSAPGVTVRPIVASNGREEFAEVFFDGVAVPAEHVIGTVDAGWAVAMYLLQYERGMYAWLRQSVLHHRLGSVVEAVDDDVRAKRAVGESFLLLAALRARTTQTVVALDARKTLGPRVSVDKVLLSSAEQATYDAARIADIGGFLAGPDTASTALRHEWFYSRATSIFGGAVDVQRDIIAQHMLGLPREERS
ncbi:acyl-CoA dehydrogenase [Rhodococcus sp. Eu-32]|uniref:acyl-CoA dehydrogenase family protein n=1 Tax=Rhodococcus sp. Eu-32 TaxID=1017319 RepID=UPI000DF354AE|nr:acyl-CoA dehydrogenase family protein [Rhodococcus sp. Eu-32]RRQ29001.1 acyl-CoA dehydrogenase [Rhodococcus sp. Eu-32]